MDNFVNGMLHGSPAGRRMEALWKVLCNYLPLFHRIRPIPPGIRRRQNARSAFRKRHVTIVLETPHLLRQLILFLDLDRFEMASQGAPLYACRIHLTLILSRKHWSTNEDMRIRRWIRFTKAVYQRYVTQKLPAGRTTSWKKGRDLQKQRQSEDHAV